VTTADAASERRARTFRRARVAVVALVIGYFFLPYSVQAWIPVWLPFLAALAVEAQFFIGGYVASRTGRVSTGTPGDRGPQPHDVAELGGEEWRDVYGFDSAQGLELLPREELERAAQDEEAATDHEDDDGDEFEDDYEYEPARRRPYARHLPEALLAIALVAGILFFAIRPHGWTAISKANRARAEAVFSRQASIIAGHPARVVCDTSGKHVGVVQEADGVALVGGNLTYITPEMCDRLYQLKFKHHIVSFSGTGRAIAVLAHESWHLHGVADEGVTNCYAFQSGVGLGMRLGLSEQKARAMMRGQLASNPIDSEGDSRYLVPPGCQNGGRYDLHPNSNAFP
jgi:hypothetical protein